LLALLRGRALRQQLDALALRLGGEHHLALQALDLELSAHRLELLLGLGARLLRGDGRLALDRLRVAFELPDEGAQLVALLRDADLGLLLRELGGLPRRGLLLAKLLVRLVLGVLGVAQRVGDRWILSVSRCSPSLSKTSLVVSSRRLANSMRSSFTCSGVSCEMTSRSAPSSVCLAVWWMARGSTVRKRSTAL
jgi:hypothetical protein